MLEDFQAEGVTVVGMSVDPVSRLQKFRDKYSLRFLLASDEGRTVGAAYRVLKNGREGSHIRSTVILSARGAVVRAYPRVPSARGHAAAVLAEVKRLVAEGRL